MSIIDEILGEKDVEKIRKETEENYREYVNPFAMRMLKNASLDIIEGKREGASVWDISGEKYIDCVTGAGIFNVGRHNPEVVEALKKALDTYDMGGWISIVRERGLLAKKLAEITPGNLKYSLFCCGGGEAIEVAIKLARGHTDKPEIICMNNGYHGVTGFALPATGRDVYKKPFAPLTPGYVHVQYNDLKAVEEAITEETAAVMLEPIQGEGGIIPADDEYLRGLRELCDKNDMLLIFDEVQTAFGRTGKMFCAEHSGVTPDIMVMAKALSGGLYPISAAIFTEEISDFLMTHPFIIINSFGGTSLACLVSLAAIEYLEKNDLPAHAEKMGKRFLKGLATLKDKYPDLILDVRGKGLMLGIEFPEDSIGPRMSYQLRHNGVISIYTFNNPRIIRIMPTLVIKEEEVDFVLDAFDKSLAEIAKQEAKNS
ncbi:MAG: aspartate aminotransferase family protein [Deltaproteobacteria bacterium]|uniref:Aspartate aminotransferase family protein n=1 Tax=Candidatus Zymogenus saltonus TaxID=2844893 RepID=A0A9D8PN85_9DELT|nr:aspartate aminotransferase family protein [Candidatus Zymogenus saltonus]